MPSLPYSRVVDVNLSRTDRFPARRGFGTMLILTTTAVAGIVDATKRTKLYTTIEEVAADYNSTTSVYKAALSAFSQNPRPSRIKVGYVTVPAGGTEPLKKADVMASLDLVNAYDNAWYFLTLDASMRDQIYLDGVVEWIEGQPKMALLDSNDVTTLTLASAVSIASRKKGLATRTGVIYHNDVNAYPAASLAAYMSTRVFDDADSAYTAKFKKLPGIAAVPLTSSALTIVTGFVEAVGQSSAAGHLANTLVDIGDQVFLVEGSTLTANVFLDEIHSTDWIQARTEEEGLAMFLNNARIPFTDQGMQQLAAVPRSVMAQGVRAGIVAQDFNAVTGDYEPAYTVTVPSIFDVTDAQRKARIAPAISVRFRYAGAVHYTTINYTMTF